MDSSNEFQALTHPWWQFKQLVEIIKYESRFVIKEPHKSFVDSVVKLVCEHFGSIIYANTILYRARINKTNFEKKEHEKTPFSPSEMGSPPNHLTEIGRVNPEGIRYLYCAGELDTAGSELRPWKGAYLTIGEVKIRQDINIADLTLEWNDNKWGEFFYDLSEMFSMQWPPELKLNYLVTQLFSEHFKAAGFRGIKYKSGFNGDGNNYALFYGNDYEIVRTYSVTTSEIAYIFLKNKDV